MTEVLYWGMLPCCGGTVYFTASKYGLCRVTLPNETFQSMADWSQRYYPSQNLVRDDTRITSYALQLVAYMKGEKREFEIPLDLRGTDFQLAVWSALQKISYGETRSYSDLATAIGRPSSVRAVGTAIGANPVPIIVPCHRVVGKNGSLTGYRGGLELKSQLLQLEQVSM